VGASFESGKHGRQRGRHLWILLCYCELDDQRDQLVLDSIVQVTLEAPESPTLADATHRG
jgi:hypothetical protein